MANINIINTNEIMDNDYDPDMVLTRINNMFNYYRNNVSTWGIPIVTGHIISQNDEHENDNNKYEFAERYIIEYTLVPSVATVEEVVVGIPLLNYPEEYKPIGVRIN